MASAASEVVLIVDDSEVMRRVLSSVVEGAGAVPVAVPGGPEALAELASRGTVLAIISDYEMPGMNGKQLYVEVRKSHTGIPFVLVTGTDEAEYAYSDMDCLVYKKPIENERFQKLVRRLIDIRRAQGCK